MNYSSVGDLSRYFHIRKSNFSLKTQLGQLTQEVTTGVKADIGKHLKGNVSGLTALETRLTRMDAYKRTSSEVGHFAGVMQTSMEVVDVAAKSLGTALISANTEDMINKAATNASYQLKTVLSALNTESAGQFVFGGTKYDSAPLVGYDELMTQVQAQVAGAATADDVIAAMDAWFSAPAGGGGFADTAFSGDPNGMETVQVSEHTKVRIAATADDLAFRNIIKGMAVSALVADGMLAGNKTEMTKLAQYAGHHVVSGQYQLTDLRSELGMVQQSVEQASSRTASDISSVKIARTSMIEADAYEAATALTQVESQLEALYSLTARLTSRSLADYI